MQHVTIERDGPLGWILMKDLPGGCLERAIVGELEAAVTELEGDDQVRALVFTGADEGVFIRHYSLKELAAEGDRIAAKGLTFDVARPTPETPIHKLFRRLEAMPKAVIAAINGMCMGGGFELALACDLRIAAAGDYAIGLPEINVGLLPGAGGTQKLPRVIGLPRALELMLLGRTLAPEEALRYGLVSEVVPDVRRRAAELGRVLASKPPRAFAHVKALARAALDLPLGDGLARERTLFADVVSTEDARRLMHAAVAGSVDIRHGETK
jgi:enoyl-CoA hydratase